MSEDRRANLGPPPEVLDRLAARGFRELTSAASETYQMTGALALADGGIAEIGHQGADVVILLHGTSRATLGAEQREHFRKLFMQAEREAEAWAREHAGAGDEPCGPGCGYAGHGQDLIDHMRYEHTRCPDCGREPRDGDSVTHKLDCPRLQPGHVYPGASDG